MTSPSPTVVLCSWIAARDSADGSFSATRATRGPCSSDIWILAMPPKATNTARSCGSPQLDGKPLTSTKDSSGSSDAPASCCWCPELARCLLSRDSELSAGRATSSRMQIQNRSLSCGGLWPASCFSASERMSTPCSVCTAAFAMVTSAKVATAQTCCPLAETSGSPWSWPKRPRIILIFPGSSTRLSCPTQDFGKCFMNTIEWRPLALPMVACGIIPGAGAAMTRGSR